MAYKFETGTVTVEHDSLEVKGVGTAWIYEYPGLALNIDGLTFPVSRITSANTLTLVRPYPGESASEIGYTLMPLQTDVLRTAKNVEYLLQNGGAQVGKSAYDLAVENGFTGTEDDWLDSLKGNDGRDGVDGMTGEIEMGALVDVQQLAGIPVGGASKFLVIPVAEGAPNVTLTQSSTVMIPKDTTSMGAALYLHATASNFVITLGLMNVPPPQPENPGGPIDLSGETTFYAPFNAITPLGIDVNGSPASFVLRRNFADSALRIRRKWDREIITSKNSTWTTGATGSPYPIVSEQFAGSMTISKAGEGTASYRNGHVVLNKNSYLKTPPLAMEFKSSSDAATTQTPPSIRLIFKGVPPTDVGNGVLMGALEAWGGGGLSHKIHWGKSAIEFYCYRDGGGSSLVYSDELFDLTASNRLIETEWVDDPNGVGGTVTFYVDGQQYGASKPTESKPRITAAADYQINASVDNTSNSVADLEVEYVGLRVGAHDVATEYTTIADGPISAEDLQNLVVDATGVTTQQPEHVLTYVANGTDEFDLKVIVGEMVLPAGRAYKAVLEDWSTGTGVVAGELVMTKPSAQNCRFEDTTLFGAQGSWTEVVPTGPAPVLDGIRYGCEGIRQGNYVQFQFVYSSDTVASPFGDPSGLNTYMRPHKWMIYDNAGTLLGRVEKPNGEPLNATSTKPVWEGLYDGRSVPMISESNRWYPHGTVRSGIIWRSHEPSAYPQSFLYANVPTYDVRVPFASHTGYSFNGFDLRIAAGGAGGDGQMNGFANWKIMPHKPFEQTYASMKDYAASTRDPYKALYTEISATPNAGLHLQYTPFNIMGRSPIVGPGGTRGDRQIMPEVVALYARDVTSKRAHDDTSMHSIALDYLTGYVSDPFNAVTNGKITPIFRNNARRNVTMRNHYYGYGETSVPDDSVWYAQVGRLSEWTTSRNPLRCNVPGSGATADKPYFGGFEIDALHAHQYPHWGSLMFQTPEFAMLGVNFSDQVRLYGNTILSSIWDPNAFAAREAAWPFMHAALLWKTASTNSSRLYSREEVFDWIVFDFETFYDQWYDNDGACFLRPPTNILNGDGDVDNKLATLAGAAKFGPCSWTADGLVTSEFQVGYWLSALHAAHKVGFLDALSAASPKAAEIVNWLKAMHYKRIIGRVNDAFDSEMAGSDYNFRYWSEAQVKAVGGDVSKLPGTFTAVANANGRTPSWDTYTIDGKTYLRDGQAMDGTLAGAALLLDMGMTGSALEAAATKSEACFQEKLASETAKGYAEAGTTWFLYHQATNNRPYKP
ncbi:hypothetical protein [Novosphingobium sp.]|jgi:hypothetical protein|uniref:hypothetical protein n=1 Tax=Novosphingobium sp. TaxID=1874826 RepID=UPI002FE1B7CF